MSAVLMGLVYYFDFTHAQRDVMLNLCDHAHDDGTDCRPSLATMCWKTGSDRRNVQKTIRSLQDMGVLVPVAYAKGGRGHPTEYTIRLFDAPLKATPPPSPGMRDLWERLKGGDITTVYTKTAKGGNRRTQRAVIGAETAVIGAEKGGIFTARTIIEPSDNHQEEPAHVRDTSLDAKNADPEAEADPPPLRGVPPDVEEPLAYARFAMAYRKRHGFNTPTQEVHDAYNAYLYEFDKHAGLEPVR